VPALDSWRPPNTTVRPRWGGVAVPPPQKFFLHFHVEMAHFVGILAVNFKFCRMNKTVKIHQNPTDTLLAVIMHEYLHKYFENIKN